MAPRTHRRKSVATWSLRERAVCRRPAGVADQFGQARLDIHMDVFEGGAKDELVVVDFLADLIKSLQNGAAIGFGQNADLDQHRAMGF